jgi:transketolase
MTLDAEAGDRLRATAREVREETLRAIHYAQTGHPGSSLSIIELLVYCYFQYLRVRPDNPAWPERDHFVLSKGHGAPSYYATLALRGYFPVRELATLRQLGSRLQGHPSAHALVGVDASTGSLGQGLSLATGLALGWKLQGRANRVVCLVGDGELQEGQNWEAAMAAAARGLDNLTVVVDRNSLQNDGPTEGIVGLGNLAAKWRSFGFETRVIDGHDFDDIHRAFCEPATGHSPKVIVANTIKGRGVSFMENVTEWHHHPVSDSQLDTALRELAGKRV